MRTHSCVFIQLGGKIDSRCQLKLTQIATVFVFDFHFRHLDVDVDAFARPYVAMSLCRCVILFFFSILSTCTLSFSYICEMACARLRSVRYQPQPQHTTHFLHFSLVSSNNFFQILLHLPPLTLYLHPSLSYPRSCKWCSFVCLLIALHKFRRCESRSREYLNSAIYLCTQSIEITFCIAFLVIFVDYIETGSG